MFAHIHGWVDEIQSDRVIIEAGGVGYELLCSGETLKTLDTAMEAKLYVHFHMSQDNITLYGFATREERRCSGGSFRFPGWGPSWPSPC